MCVKYLRSHSQSEIGSVVVEHMDPLWTQFLMGDYKLLTTSEQCNRELTLIWHICWESWTKFTTTMAAKKWNYTKRPILSPLFNKSHNYYRKYVDCQNKSKCYFFFLSLFLICDDEMVHMSWCEIELESENQTTITNNCSSKKNQIWCWGIFLTLIGPKRLSMDG